jgi:DNA repair exonuclease SbcCD nuclease subunit
VRFVHAADLHLDAPFAGVDASDPRVRSALVASTIEAFERIVTLCIGERVDFLVISGDVYDNSRSMTAQLRFQRQTVRLAEAGIAVFVAQGNHDPADGWTAGLKLPETVRYFSTSEVERVPYERDGHVVCVLYGRGYEHAAEERNLAKGFSRDPSDPIAIGVLHTNVGGREGSENYAPASMDDLRAARMDYWALGHIHKPEVLSETPAIVYAGCPQGRSPKEDGVRGCYLIEMDGHRAETRFIPTCSIVWERLSVDVTGAAGIEDVRDALRDACGDARSRADGSPAIVRIDLLGRTDAHAALIRGGVFEELVRDLREEQLAGGPWVWMDRVLDRTTASLDIDTLRDSEDFAGDLVRLTDDLLADPAMLAGIVAGALGPIESALGFHGDIELSPGRLLERARDLCLDRLEGEER